MQAYSLAFWPKIANFVGEIFDQFFRPIFVLAYSLILWQNIGNFFLKILTNFLSHFSPSQIFAKMQAYSLTFWPKIANFVGEIFDQFFRPIFVPVKFWQKTKPIALFFGQI